MSSKKSFLSAEQLLEPIVLSARNKKEIKPFRERVSLKGVITESKAPSEKQKLENKIRRERSVTQINLENQLIRELHEKVNIFKKLLKQRDKEVADLTIEMEKKNQELVKLRDYLQPN